MTFEEIYEKFYDNLFKFIYANVGNFHESEDIIHEVFIKVYRKLDTFQNKSNIKTWIFSIALNTIKDFFRKKSATNRLHKKLLRKKIIKFFESDKTFHNLSKIEKEEILKAILQIIPEHLREVLILSLSGLSYKEASETLGITEATYKMRLFRAKKLLKKYLKVENYDL